jgi:hypothetical protein
MTKKWRDFMKLFCLLFLAFNLTQAYAETKTATKDGPAKVKMSREEQFKMVLSANDFLYDNLLKKDQDAVEASARQLQAAIKKTDAPVLKALREARGLDAIKKTNNKDQNLEAYSQFMPTLVAAMKKEKTSGYEVFYCPMVKKEWIQNLSQHPDVTNVFAQYMLDCGEKSKL